MSLWAEVLHSKTPTTDHRWLALPDYIDTDRAEQANDILSKRESLGIRAQINWIIRLDSDYVWLGAFGSVEDLFGLEFDGLPITLRDNIPDSRPNSAFAGFVTARSKLRSLPRIPIGVLQPPLLRPIGRFYKEHWGPAGARRGHITRTIPIEIANMSKAPTSGSLLSDKIESELNVIQEELWHRAVNLQISIDCDGRITRRDLNEARRSRGPVLNRGRDVAVPERGLYDDLPRSSAKTSWKPRWPWVAIFIIVTTVGGTLVIAARGESLKGRGENAVNSDAATKARDQPAVEL